MQGCQIIASKGSAETASWLAEIIGGAIGAPVGTLGFAQLIEPAALVVLVPDRRSIDEALDVCRRLSGCDGVRVVVVCQTLPQRTLASLLVAGADEFIALPCDEVELLNRIGLRANAVSIPAPQATRHARLRGLIGSSSNFTRQLTRLPLLAGCDAGVLILGETGTGKEMFAQAVHYLSARASQPWVAVNCGAIPDELIENELFGHVRGAYTTAHVARSGLVAEAEGGTLFLDDVDCLPLAAQAKLLRFLQEKEYRPVGANTVARANVRIIAACNQQMDELVQRSLFRRDLYFRLKILTLSLPPLRERCEDIRPLAQHFVSVFAREFGRNVTRIGPEALTRLCTHDWPGNVRELRHTIERAVLLCDGSTLELGQIELDGPLEVELAGEPESFQSAKARVVARFERSYIENLLASHGGNITQAANAASKNRRAFFELMRKHQIEPQRFRTPL